MLCFSGYMHCDRNEEDSSSSWDRGGVRGRLSEKHERGSRLSDRDEREARYWTRKLYEFEANDPDRCVCVVVCVCVCVFFKKHANLCVEHSLCDA